MAETKAKKSPSRSTKKPVAKKPAVKKKVVETPVAPAEELVNTPSKTSQKRWVLIVVLIILAAASVSGFFIWRYYDTQKQLDRLSNPQEAAKVEVQQLVNKVGKLAELPRNETPTIATVQDVEKLKDQAFFVDAQVGDKTLIYQQAKKAYLYRPSTNKIINIAPLNIGTSPSSASQQ